MNIHIIAIGDLKEKYLQKACDEYIKRLSRFGHVKITELPEYVGKNGCCPEKEGQEILKHLRDTEYLVALCIEGKQMDSIAFSGALQTAAINGKSCATFIIGGSDGLWDEVKKRASLRLSFSPMTFPHQLMRLILLEQVYRAFKIMSGQTYHK